MKTTRLARRLGLDGNPLRRRLDKIAACLAALLMAVFLIGAPMLSTAAARWVGHAVAAGQRAARSWRQVPAVLLRGAPLPDVGGGFGTSWVRARWTAPDGHMRTGRIPVSTSLAAGSTVQLWVDAAGSPTGPPPRYAAPARGLGSGMGRGRPPVDLAFPVARPAMMTRHAATGARRGLAA
jgi:hypothetical protein